MPVLLQPRDPPPQAADTPTDAGVAAERGAASQEAASALGDEAMVANATEGPNEGDFRKTSAEPDMIDFVVKETGADHVGTPGSASNANVGERIPMSAEGLSGPARTAVDLDLQARAALALSVATYKSTDDQQAERRSIDAQALAFEAQEPASTEFASDPPPGTASVVPSEVLSQVSIGLASSGSASGPGVIALGVSGEASAWPATVSDGHSQKTLARRLRISG